MNNVITVDLASGHQVIRKSTYYQHDFGLKLRLENAPDCPLLVEFCNLNDKKIQHDEPYTGADIEIPRDLLQKGDLWIFVSVQGPDFFRTLKEVIVRVIRRPSRPR